MAKRRAAVASDNEGPSDASPASKRARTNNESADDDVQVVASATPKRERRDGKRKARRNGDGNEDEEEEADEEEAEGGTVKEEGDKEAEEKQFEEVHGERIRAAIEAKRKVQGGIASHGIIESIEMLQFMCHQYLTFTFGPQINFIIGHNGSGKSAVLSAITVALGGKATSTGRGTGLKSFIREGQSAAEVTIKLKNQGEEAYKPKEYGESIIITRKFTKEGSSSWKIKSDKGKVISTKKDELSAICDHMNIQVDNPMNVLTQDAARQFLSASHPSDKYKFFLRGTQLSQLSDEYDTCLENITQTTKVLQQKKTAIPELRKAFKDATMRFNEASKAREQRYKADELKKELAWAHVATKEDEMKRKFEEVAKMERRLPKIQDSIQAAEAQFQAASQEVARFEEEHHNLGDIEDLNTKKQELQAKLRENKGGLADYKNNEKQMDQSLKAVNKQIANYEARIAEEAKRMEVHTQAKREETKRKLEAACADVQAADTQRKEIIDRKRERLGEVSEARNRGQAADAERAEAQKRISECEEQIGRCRELEKNNLSVYGKNIRGVLDQIGRTRWHGQPPVGPLGVHVKLKDQQWAPLLRNQIGQLMTAFACTDSRDRPQLKSILNQSKNDHVSIIISERDMFDYSHGEPPAHMLTVLRALDVSDPYVLRVLINQARIERIFLAKTRLEGQNILNGVPGGGSALTGDLFRVNKYGDGGSGSNVLQKLRNDDPKHHLFTDKDPAAQLRIWAERKSTSEDQYKAALAEVSRYRKMLGDAERALQELNREEERADARHRRAKMVQATLQEEANEELPVGIASLETAKAEAESEKKSILEQFEQLMTRKAEVDNAQHALLTRINELKKQIDAFEEQRVAIQGKIEEAAAARLVAQNGKNHYEKKHGEETDKVRKAQEGAETLREEFENWEKKAEEYCERFANPRKVEEVQRNLDSVQAALRERERSHGATVEEMTIEVNKAKANLDSAERDLRNMSALNKALKASLVVRLAKWQEFRRHIALRCKLVFSYHLSNRGYYGKVLFDHINGTLQLKVQTDDQMGTEGRDKDPRSLSGGEKSFSTICLLLSLWESIGCPLRCLDEFDVFMDAVNRRISMRMMIDTANASDKKQYVLITPQDMNNVQMGQTVRVHRMTDPERGQGTLEMNVL